MHSRFPKMSKLTYRGVSVRVCEKVTEVVDAHAFAYKSGVQNTTTLFHH